MSKNTRTNNSIDFSWLIKTNWYPKSPLNKLFMLSYFLGCSRAWFMKVVQKYIGREPSGRTFNEIALDYNGQPHNPMVCVISNQPAKMIELFCNFFPGQQWCHHVCFSSSVHGQTRAHCFREVWICPPFLLKVAFHLASCVIESSITNWTLQKRRDNMTNWLVTALCRSVWSVDPPSFGRWHFFPVLAQTWYLSTKKNYATQSFGAKKSGDKVEIRIFANLQQNCVSVGLNKYHLWCWPAPISPPPAKSDSAFWFLRAVRHCHLMSTN